MPTLAELALGGRWVAIDPRLEPRPDETTVVKKGASAFFGTNLVAVLNRARGHGDPLWGDDQRLRALAIDLLQYGYPTLIPRECVGDRAHAPHEANLFDIDGKYADVVAPSRMYVDSVSGKLATTY